MIESDELTSLARDIAGIDGAQAAPGIEAKAALVVEKTAALESAAEGWAEIPESIGIIVGLALPECKDAFRREACLEWGKHAARVAEKHGWSTDGLPPEVSLLLASLGFALPVGLAVKTRRDKAKQPPATGGQGDGQAHAKG